MMPKDDHATSDLAGLAAREAGAPVRGPTRIEEIRARLEAATLAPGAGIETHAEALRVFWAHAPDDLRHLLNEVTGYQSDLLAGERALKEARRERDENANTALGLVTEGLEWRSRALTAERERDATRAEVDECHADLLAGAQAIKKGREERDTLTADLARARRILAVEQGREGPEGWTWDAGKRAWRHGLNAVWQEPETPGWVWGAKIKGEFVFHLAPNALEAIEAAERADGSAHG